MTATLLFAALSGMLLMLNEGRVSLAGNLYGELPEGATPPETRFIDRAHTWVGQGLGGTAALAVLLAFSGFVVIFLWGMRSRRAPSDRLRVCGAAIGGLLTLLEATGPIALIVGYAQLLSDPTAARDPADQLRFHLPTFVLCLVLAVLFAAATWILHGARTKAPKPEAEASGPPPIEQTEDDPHRLFRRPAN